MRKVGDWTPGTQSCAALRLYGFCFLHSSWPREAWMLLPWLSHASLGTLHPPRAWLDNIKQNPWEPPRWKARPHQPQNSDVKTKKHEELTLPIDMPSPAHHSHNQPPHSTISTPLSWCSQQKCCRNILPFHSSGQLPIPQPHPRLQQAWCVSLRKGAIEGTLLILGEK